MEAIDLETCYPEQHSGFKSIELLSFYQYNRRTKTSRFFDVSFKAKFCYKGQKPIAVM